MYAGKFEKIVCFGGWSVTLDGENGKSHDDIFYIDLSNYEATTPFPTTTLNPDYFSCVGRPNGKLLWFYCYLSHT